MTGLNRQDRPPPPGPRVKIIRVKSIESHMFAILSKQIWGVWTHWNGRASEPCTGDSKTTCEGHKREFPLRWKGYLCCLGPNNSEQCFLELTPQAATDLLAQLPTGVVLRAYRLDMRRTSNTRGARYKVTVWPPLIAPEYLPGDSDPERELSRLWGSHSPFKDQH